MRVLLISKWVAGGTKGDFYYPGVWRDTFELALALRRCGLEVAILTPKIQAYHLSRFNREFGYQLEKNKIKYFVSNFSPAFGYDWGYFRLKMFFFELTTIRIFKPDIIQYMEFSMSLLHPFVKKIPIFFYSCYFPRFYPGENDDLKIKRKCWGTKDDFISGVFNKVFNFVYYLLILLFGSATVKQIAKRGGYLVLMHKSGYRIVRDIIKKNQRIFFIQKGIDFHRSKKIISQYSYKKRKNKNVLFVGSLFYGKGILDLLKTFKEVQSIVKDARLIIVGTGPYEQVKEINKVISKKNLNAEFIGSQDYNKKWQLYLNSAVFCLPSYRDAYPSVIFEALMAKLPVITTLEIDSPVRHKKDGLKVHAGDIKALAKSIIKLLQNDEERLKISSKINLDHKKYSWDIAAYKFLTLYRKSVRDAKEKN